MNEQKEISPTQDQVDEAWAQAIKFHYIGRSDLPTPEQIKICRLTQVAFTETLKDIEAQGKIALVHPDFPESVCKRMEALL